MQDLTSLAERRRRIINRLLNGNLDEATKEQGYRTLRIIDIKMRELHGNKPLTRSLA